MKLLQINSVYKSGSTGNIVANIHKLIQEENLESLVAYSRDDFDEDNLIKIGSKFDMYIHGLGTRVFDKHGLYSKKATQEFIDVIDKLNIDIVHLHNIHGYYLNYELLFEYLKKNNKRVIWTLHDCWSFTGHCAYYDFIGCDKWKDVCHQCPQKKMYPSSLIFDNSEQNFLLKKKLFTSIDNMTIVTPSQWLADEISESFLKKYPVKVIYNGIDLDVFKPIQSDFRKRLKLKNNFLILGVANVWEERKGFNYFIELAEIIKDDEKIILIGLNESQMKNLPENIIGFRRTSNLQELVEIYCSVDVFVNPTLEEVLGLTNLESIACGTPVITFDSGGSKETIDDRCGFVVQKENLDGLYSAIQTVKERGKASYSTHCRERAVSHFNKDDRFKEYIELYKEIKK